jgi:uncharacterized protein involved in exopolysaccharide biosynthesis/Mrp family chromosome partitioning ATPase
MADQNQTQQKTIRDILFILFRYKWVILTVFFMVMIPTFLVLISQPDIYLSNAKILISSGQINPLEMATGMSVSSEMYAELELIKSRGLAEEVVDRIGPELVLAKPPEKGFAAFVNSQKVSRFLKKIGMSQKQDMRDMDPIRLKERAVINIQEMLTVRSASRSNVINLTYQALNPDQAQFTVQTVIDTYMDKHLQMHTAKMSLEFLSDETDKLKEELFKTETELRQFKQEVKIVSLFEQRSLLLQRLEVITQSIQETEADIHATRAVIENMEDVFEFRAPLKEHEITLESYVARLAKLRAQHKAVQREINRLAKNEQRYLSLQKNVDLLNEKYSKYRNSLEQARIAQTLESQKISNISIIQEPTYMLEPMSRERRKKLGLGLFAAIALSVGIAFVLKYLNHRIETVDEIRNNLGWPNIVTIPAINTKEIVQSLKKQEIESGAHLILHPNKIARHITVWLYLVEEIRECFENIKAKLQSAIIATGKGVAGKAPYVLGVTSAYRGEGVSSVATGIAYVFSLTENQYVLLVDSNSHHPDEDKIIGANRPPGLFELAVGGTTKEEKGDDVKPFPSVKDMEGYFTRVDGSEKIDKMLPSVQKQNYNLIVIDLPSMSEGVATLKSAALVDGVVVVVESQKVRREVLKNIKEKFEDTGVHIFGVVLNKRRFFIPNWLYSKV